MKVNSFQLWYKLSYTAVSSTDLLKCLSFFLKYAKFVRNISEPCLVVMKYKINLK